MIKRYLRWFVLACVFGFIYLFGVVIFSFLFPFRVYVNDRSVAFMSVSDAVMDQIYAAQNQMFVFKLRNASEESVRFCDLGISLIGDLQSDIRLPSPWSWPVRLFKDTVYRPDVHYDWDVDKLIAGLQGLNFMADDYDIKPTNARVSILDDGSFEVIPAFSGTSVDFDKLFDCVCGCLANGECVLDLDANGCYVSLSDMLEHDDIVCVSDDISVIRNVQITIDMGCDKSEIVPESVLSACTYKSDDKVYLDYDLFFDYVSKLKHKYDTIGSVRTFKTSNGNVIRLSADEQDTFYGWDLNVDQTVAVICELLLSGKSGSVDAVYYHTGFSHDSDNDFGDSYIELSIKDQHMWVYLDGKLDIDTDVTTGKDEPITRTPTGLFHTMDFNTEYQMHGWYGTAFSHYFIRVTPEGVGIHDASWRSKYGGDYYIKDGSHGCINTPFSAVKHIFYRLLDHNGGAELPVIIY